MATIKGMLVSLKTKNEALSGTEDHIYVGIVGTGGGSEFPLDVNGFKDFAQGSDIKYKFGDVWEASALVGAREPFEGQGENDPEGRNIDLDQV